MKLLLLALLTGCFTKRVETYSHPTTVRLRFATLCDGVVEQHVGAGEYRAVAITGTAAEVAVPAMGGGYSERGGKKFDESDPDTYDVIRLRTGERVLIDLSLKEIRSLPRDGTGHALVPVQCV